MPFTPFQNQPYTDFSLPENAKAMRDAIARVRADAGKEYPLIIGGERITANEKFQSINPSKKDEVLGVFQKGTPELTAKAVETAAKAFESWKRTKPETRAVVLQRAAEIMKRRRHELSATMVL
ncbi:MAG: aldehyde dehydrogenase family protein, partial [candidate division WOR-3 bacterium]